MIDPMIFWAGFALVFIGLVVYCEQVLSDK